MADEPWQEELKRLMALYSATIEMFEACLSDHEVLCPCAGCTAVLECTVDVCCMQLDMEYVMEEE